MSRFRPASLQPILDALGQTIVVFDQFNRADNASSLGKSATGQIWTPLRGTWGISGKRAKVFANVSNDSRVMVDAGVSDNYAVSADFYVTNEPYRYAGLMVKVADLNNYVLIRYQRLDLNNELAVYRFVGGTQTQLGQKSTPALSGYHHMRVVVQGTAINVYLNETKEFEITDSDESLNGNTGVGIRMATDTNTLIDNFKVEVLT